LGEVYFYHITQSEVDTTLAMLLRRARQAGWRVVVRGRDRTRMEALDQALWRGGDAAFLPHGLAGGPHDALQPVLLTWAEAAQAQAPQEIQAECLMTIDGAPVSPEQVATAQRVCVLFDGRDEAAQQQARQQWRALTKGGCAARYWAQEDASGKWVQKAQSQ